MNSFLTYITAIGDDQCLIDNQAYRGGGMFLGHYSGPTVLNSIFAYNSGHHNMYQSLDDPAQPSFQYCAFYPAAGDSVYNIPLDDTNLMVDPGFVAPPIWDDGGGLWVFDDLHLATDSPLVNMGYDGADLYEEVAAALLGYDFVNEEGRRWLDPDGSPPDIGSYGGPCADGVDLDGDGTLDCPGWDLDGDGYNDYFWPGSIDDAPDGFDPNDYDMDDRDPDLH